MGEFSLKSDYYKYFKAQNLGEEFLNFYDELNVTLSLLKLMKQGLGCRNMLINFLKERNFIL